MTRYIRVAVISTLLISLLTFTSNAQNARRGYKLLEKKDYTKARELFSGALKETSDHPASMLGMMVLLADDSSDFFDPVDAWKYGSALQKLMDKFTPDDLEFIGEYFYNTEVRHINRPVKKKIEYAIETVEAKLIKYVREENNLELVYRVLEAFPDFRHYNNCIHIRNQLEFRKYEKLNTLEGYLEFMKKFPEAAQIEKAKRYCNKLAFEKACSLNTVEAYKNYIKEYPDASEVNTAIKNLHAVAFDVAKKANTIQALEAYMAEYPDALEISEARQLQKQLLYEYAKKIQTLEAYNEFIRKYPEGQYYIDIFNLKSLDNGMKFLSAYPIGSNNILWARSFDEENTDEISACFATDSLNNYIVGATVFRNDTGYTDAWILKLNSDGKMIWNKYVGEAFNDEIYLITCNRKSEIIGAGYTWTGTDSSSRESWIFKLGADGSKIWSRKLGKMHIKSLTAGSNGSIYAAGYLVNDSLQDKYSIVVLHEQGKRLWARTYTGKGRIIYTGETKDGNMIVAGTSWCAKITPKGYILGEHKFDTDSVVACNLANDNSVHIVAIRDSATIVMHGLDATFKPAAGKIPQLSALKCRVNSVVRGNDGILAMLLTFDDHQAIYRVDGKTGNVVSKIELPAGVLFDSLEVDKRNNLVIEACDGQVIIIKNNGLAL